MLKFLSNTVTAFSQAFSTTMGAIQTLAAGAGGAIAAITIAAKLGIGAAAGASGIGAGIAALAATPVGWVILGVGALVAATIMAYAIYSQNQHKSDGGDMVQNMIDQREENPTIVSPDQDQLKELAKADAGIGNQDLTDDQKNAMAAVNQGLNEVAQPPTVEEMQQKVNDQGLQSQEEALNRFNEMLAQLNQGRSPEENMSILQNENNIENPFSETIGENKENIEEEIEKEIEKYEEELDFDKGDFDDLEGYKFMINNTLVTLYVKSDITLLSEDENFQNITSSNISSEKYTDKKGQTHAISNAYDADGKKLDKVIMSSQIGYLEIGLDGANGIAKFSGTGNEEAYEIHGYGETSFGKKEYKVSVIGSYDLKENERDKETLLGTNSSIISQKEYKFRDDGSIELAESETNALFDTFQASIKWACDVMREVNLKSYVLDLGEADFIMGEKEDNDDDEIEIEENGITYTFDANATITNTETGATYLVKDLLEKDVATIEELIEKGFEPNTVNGKTYESKEDIEDAITDTKPKFEIKIDKAQTPENYEKEIIHIDENGVRYYFTTKCSHRYHIITEDGDEYTIKEALEIYTIEELMDKGLDCKISVI